MTIEIYHSENSMFKFIRGIDDIIKESYTCVYKYTKHYRSKISAKEILEDVFSTFNIAKPKDYKLRSMHTGDIVKLNGDYHLCKSIGWEKLEKDTIEEMCI